MKASEELIAQQDFLLANKWIVGFPSETGEGCLVVRTEELSSSPLIRRHYLEGDAITALWTAIARRGQPGEFTGWRLNDCTYYNDFCIKSAGEAIAILDEAILLAKEFEA